MVPDATPMSYYGRPILEEPAWKWPIPAYFFTGGLAAGSSLLAAGARLTGNEPLARRASVSAAAAIAVSSGLLIDDLGKPTRFANMLRVVKPTSPMSVGSWILAAYGPAAGTAALSELTGLLPGIGRLAELSAAALAPAVASYTAVLIADTAVPAWHEARHVLPLVFVSGAAASAGGLAAVLLPPEVAGSARRMAVLGALGELVNTQIIEQTVGEAAEPYHTGKAGRLGRIARVCTAAGAAAIATLGRKRRSAAVAGGLLLFVGAATERFAVFEAGRQSARDPKYTVDPQRARLQS
jgi:DMSO reductase anchor subunit